MCEREREREREREKESARERESERVIIKIERQINPYTMYNTAVVRRQ